MAAPNRAEASLSLIGALTTFCGDFEAESDETRRASLVVEIETAASKITKLYSAAVYTVGGAEDGASPNLQAKHPSGASTGEGEEGNAKSLSVVAGGNDPGSGPGDVKIGMNTPASSQTTQKSTPSATAQLQRSSVSSTSTGWKDVRGLPSDPEYFGYSADMLKPPGLDLNDVCPCTLHGHECLYPKGCDFIKICWVENRKCSLPHARSSCNSYKEARRCKYLPKCRHAHDAPGKDVRKRKAADHQAHHTEMKDMARANRSSQHNVGVSGRNSGYVTMGEQSRSITGKRDFEQVD